jgi:hypothetical protein
LTFFITPFHYTDCFSVRQIGYGGTTNQADSMMGHAGMERSDACTQPAASFVLADYAAETEDESYCLLWEAMNAEFEQLGAQGCTAANCVFTDDMIILMR